MKIIKNIAVKLLVFAPLLCSYSLAGVTVSSSGNDGNISESVLDGDLSTRWSAKGDGQWIQFDLGSNKKIDDLDIAFYKGNTRVSYFDVLLSENNIKWGSLFSGSSSQKFGFENFNIIDTTARYVRIVGHGNSANTWNSLTEVKINTLNDTDDLDSNDDATDSEINAITTKITTKASSDDGHAPENTLDNDPSPDSRWSAKGDGEWIQYDLGSIIGVQDVAIAFYKGNSRITMFDILTSTDQSNWHVAFSGSSPEKTLALQHFDIAGIEARYIKIIGHGNSKNNWNSLTEVKFYTESVVDNEDDNDTCNPCINHTVLKSIFDTEGDSPYADASTLRFDALKSKHTTPNGHGWRNELKVKKDLRIAMSGTYEEFQADLTIDLSPGSKTIIAQHHASDTGTLMKVYVSDTSESGFDNSIAIDGIFDVYVRLRNNDGSEEKISLGTVISGDTFNLHVINDYGDVSVSALGTSTSLKVKDDSSAYFKFGNYLQAQDPVTMKKVKKSRDFGEFYADQGIIKSVITMTNVNYVRIQ